MEIEIINYSGLKNILENNNIIVYPNPATDFLNIQTKKDIEQIDVYSLSGRLLLSEKDSRLIDVTTLPDGVYLLKMYLKNSESCMKRILVK